MKKIKILHTSDFHFDTPFREVSESQRNINKEELKEVFRNIVQYTKEEKIEIMLIAGDVFDNFTINKETLFFLEEILKTLDSTKVFISPGNHDPFGEKSFYKMINWPSNVYIFEGAIEKVYVEDLDVNVWGGAFNEKYLRESLLKDFTVNNNKINIMVLHGELSQGGGTNEYNPINKNEIRDCGIDYLALGHRHNFSGILKEGGSTYAYCGCPQGRGFDELGEKGVITGFISKGVTQLEFLPTCKRRYNLIEVDITNAFTYEEVRKKIIGDLKEEERRNNLYKIILKGEISPDFNIDEDLIKESLGLDFHYIKVIDKTVIKHDFEEISKGYSVKGIFVKNMIKKIMEAEGEEREVLELALKLGLNSLSLSKVNLNDY